MRLEIEQSVDSTTVNYFRQPVEESSSNGIDVARLLKQGVSAAQSGERALARTLLLRVTEADPKNTDAWLWLASISEYPEELLGFLENVLSVDPDNFRARQWKSATQSLLAKTFVQRGISANEEGQVQFAVDCFDKALEQDDRCESALVWKASLMESEIDREDLLVRALLINPDNSDARSALDAITGRREQQKLDSARAAAVSGDLSGAESILHEVLANDPDSTDAWLLMSQVAAPFSEKMLAYRRILELDPTNALATAGHDYLSDMVDSFKTEEPAVAPESFDETVSENVSDEHAADESVEMVAPDQSQQNGYYQNSIVPVVSETTDSHELHAGSNASEQISDVMNEVLESYYEPVAENEVGELQFDDDETVVDSVDLETETLSFHNSFEETDTTDEEEELVFADQRNDQSEVSHEQECSDELAEPHVFEAREEQPEWPSEQPVAEDIYAAAPEVPYSDSDVEEHIPQAHCPYCNAGNEPHAFECSSCQAVLSLSDLERLLAHSNADQESLQESVTKMESEWNLREFSEQELTVLGIGQLNLKNNDAGFAYLQEAARTNPNNVILASQVNALAIRLDEIRRQTEVHDAMPKGKTILVVDDSPTVRKLISSKLEKSGHNVVCAEDGVDAMTVLESTVPDLVLLDIAMPRMDGYAVCKLIRSNDATKEVPVVMISGKDGFFDKVRGRMAGTTGYITKPFGPETLMRALETYLLPDMAEND
ncbi:MAG TPA: response regulator [Pyrinomonadaceae bacterium]|nr:response regulator [Pyrinomonadaceae bacterium]HQX54923.1 response regulator [Pyrinomonadaceae bacterium]HQY66795.1 response regulator [Pyrinomonadaceae bacterium]HRA40669.1 response regulator [Pyrinomonadaceae bacterium]